MAGVEQADLKETIYQLHQAGLLNSQIAREVGISPPTVAKYVAELGLVKNERRTKMDAINEGEFVRAYFEEEWPVAEITNYFGISATEIYGYLRTINRNPRTKQKVHQVARNDALDHAIDLYTNQPQMTVAEICAETGIQQPRLHEEIRRRKVPFRRPSMVRDIQWYD